MTMRAERFTSRRWPRQLSPWLLISLAAFMLHAVAAAAPSAAQSVPSSARPALQSCEDRITNGGFETGDFAGWESLGGPLVDDYSRSGAYAARLGGVDNADHTIHQAVSMPAEAITATLSFQLSIFTEEEDAAPFDYLRVEAQDDGGAVIEVLAEWHNGQASELWLQGIVDLTEHPGLLGQDWRLAFHATTDASMPTSFHVDDVRLEVCEAAITCFDAYEPNETAEDAVDLPLQEDLFSFICDGEDQDYFRFLVQEDEEIYLVLDGDGGAPLPADYDLQLLDPEQESVAVSNLSGEAPEAIVHAAGVAGTWFVRVHGFEGASSTEMAYRLRLEITPISPPPPTPEDTPTTEPPPTPVPTLSATPTAAQVSATSTPAPVSTSSATPTLTAIPADTATPTDTAPPTSSATPTAAPLPIRGCPESPTDDDPASASRLVLGGPAAVDYLCTPLDQDYFRFDLVLGEVITLDLFGLPADYAFELWDQPNAPGGPVAIADRPGSVDETLTHSAASAGTHYVKVFSPAGDFNPLTPYNLQAYRGGPTATPVATAVPSATPTPRYPGCLDGFEPNNSPSETLWSILDAAKLSHICAADDIDFWRIQNVALSDTLRVRLFDQPKNYDLTLLRPDGTEARRIGAGGVGDEVIPFTADQAGTYLARVDSRGEFDLTRGYSIEASLDRCRRDRFERIAGNDAAFSASFLGDPGPGRTESGLSLCPRGDEDWFVVSLGAGRRFRAELSHTRGTELLKMCLFDRDQTTQLGCTPGSAMSEALTHDVGAQAAGDYYLRIEAASPSQPINGYYNLYVEAPEPTPTPSLTPRPTATSTPAVPVSRFPSCPDRYEPNDDPASARPVGNGVEAYICTLRQVTLPDGTTESIDDEDYWRIDVTADPGIPSRTIYATLSDRNYLLQLIDPDGRTIAARGVSATGKPPFTASTTATRGTWYARVVGAPPDYSSETEPYRLSVRSKACPDRYEPNDRFDESMAIAVAAGSRAKVEPYLCHEMDTDFFHVEVATGQRLELVLTGYAPDYDMTLFDPWRNPIKTARSGLIHDAQVSGRHVIRVRSRSGRRASNRLRYELSVELGARPNLPRRDLWLMDMEVNQRLQNLDNDLPVLTQLPTMVRLYPALRDVGRSTSSEIRGYLSATLDGRALTPPRSTCSSVQGASYGQRTSRPQRASLGRSLNCVLPADWLKSPGVLEITGVVYALGIDETSSTDNRRVLSQRLAPSAPMILHAVQVRNCGKGEPCPESKGPDFSSYRTVHTFAERLFPLRSITLVPPGSRSIRADGIEGTYNRLLLEAVYKRNVRRGAITDTVHAVMGAAPKLSTTVGGYGWNQAFWAEMGLGKGLVAHEMGHSLGLQHVDACGAPIDKNPPSYRGLPKLDHDDPRAAYGLDFGKSPAAVYAPQDKHDIMTYCYDWISHFSYKDAWKGVKDALAGRQPGASALELSGARPAARPAQVIEIEPNGTYHVLVGTINPDTHTTSLLPPERLLGREIAPMALSPAGTDYRIQVVGGDGRLVAERGFAPEAPSEGDAPLAFAVLLPEIPADASLRVMLGDDEIHRVAPSDNAPTVSLATLPDEIDGPFDLRWSVADADGDGLTVSLYLSLDDGATWTLEASGLGPNDGPINAAFWPETEAARLRLRASDGLREAEAISDPFRIPAKAPVVSIASPDDGADVSPEGPTMLSASVWDPEDGGAEALSVVWTSDREGELGSGDRLLVRSLRPGWHHIQVTATDADGLRASDRVRVFVGRRIYLPTAVRR